VAVCRFEALGRGTAAPVAVCLGALLGQVGDFADGLIHRIAYLYYTGSTVALRAMPTSQNRDMGHPVEEENGAFRIL